MATAIFNKISQVKYDKVKVVQTMLDHEILTQDGFRVLYAFLSFCHPNLVENSKLDVPRIQQEDNLFNFVSKYQNWLQFETISGQKYSELEHLKVIITAMESDGHFVKVL